MILLREKMLSSARDAEGYKYLGILGEKKVFHDQVKEKLKRVFLAELKKIMSGKLNGKNSIDVSNTRAVSIMRFRARIVDWEKSYKT